MSAIERHVIVNQGSNSEKCAEAFLIAMGMCSFLRVSRLTILCNVIERATGGILNSITNQDTAKKLQQRKPTVWNGLNLELKSKATLDEFNSYDVILGLYLGKDAIDRMDTITSVKGVVFLAWMESEANDWIQRWSPTVHGNIQITSSGLSQVIIDALQNLTSSVNLATGILHSSDKARAIETFTTLKRKGCRCQAPEIKSWAIGNGWRPEDADALAKLAKRLSS